MVDLIAEKLQQVPSILQEQGIDLWLTFVRESGVVHDPAIDMIVGTNVVWRAAFILTASGQRVAIVGSLDKAELDARGHYGEVIPYVGGMGEILREQLDRFAPSSIALNYSVDDESSDGLTHGMFLYLTEVLAGTVHLDHIRSAEGIIGALRGRKSPAEVERVRQACQVTEDLFAGLTQQLAIGMTERGVANLLEVRVEQRGLECAWIDHCPAVFTGPMSAGAHAVPTGRVIEPGHLMNIDFGVRVNDYCSDLQRTWYFMHSDDDGIPKEVVHGFETVRDAIQRAAELMKPGTEGWQVDMLAREFIMDQGYEEYPHALGHQIGRQAHDGAGLLCPRWERYGRRPYLRIEEGQIYTLEPRVTVPGFGVATVEEIVVVDADGCRFLSTPQEKLICIDLNKVG